MEPGNAIFIGAVLATLGWIYNGRLQVQSARRKHTYELILEQHRDETYAARLAAVRQLISNRTLQNIPSDQPPPDHPELDALLNYYEFLAAAIWCGDVDERLMRRCHKSRIVTLYEESLPYILANRDDDAQETMWQNLETLAQRWRGDVKPLPFQRLIERIAMRPFNPGS